MRTNRLLVSTWLVPAFAAMAGLLATGQTATTPQTTVLPETPMTFGAFTAVFGRDGAFTLQGQGWDPLKGV